METHSTICCTLSQVVRDKTLLSLVEKVVIQAAQYRKRVSLLHKDLILTKLAAGEALPIMDNKYFSALYTSVRNTKLWRFNHPEVLARHRFALPPLVCPGAMRAIMSIQARSMAAALKTHIQTHFDTFHSRWCRTFQINANVSHHNVDLTRLSSEELLPHLWEMRKDLEEENKKGYTLLPECAHDIGYIWLDTTAVASLYDCLYPELRKGDQPIDYNLWVDQRYRKIFKDLFFMRRYYLRGL